MGVLHKMLLLTMLSTVSVAQAEGFTNFFGMKFVKVPAGSFQMGAAKQMQGVQFDELPQHTVDVPAFEIMTTEMPLSLFKRYIIESSDIRVLSDEFMKANAFGDSAPVVFVSWNDARRFLHWLNRNKPASDKGTYVLPTEAEWEYACHAGKLELYCGSDRATEVAWYSSKTVVRQQAIAAKKPNAYGLYDMSGNVREWVKDCYHRDYTGAPDTAREWTKGCASHNRIVRGGSWNEGKDAARATDRMAARMTDHSPTIGFRVVRKTQ